MISPFLPVQAADTVALDFGVFIAEQARTHRVSQTAIIAALRPCITPSPDHIADAGKMVSATPSQPEATSKPHAPAADTPATQAAGVTTDGGAQTSSLASPSVQPTPEPQPSAEAVQASGTSSRVDLSPSDGLSSSLPGAECAEDRAPIRKRPRKETARSLVLATHTEHPDWPSKLIAQHLGISEDAVRATASRKGLKLVSWWDYERSLKAQTRQALAASVAKPPEAEAPPVEPQDATAPETPLAPTPAPARRVTMADKIVAYVADHPNATAREVADGIGAKITSVNWAAKSAGVELRKMTSEELSRATSRGINASRALAPATPELPPLSKPSERLPLPPPVVRPARREPSGRFYLRDRVTGFFVHQELSPSKTGDGPLMIFGRQYAWCDTMEKYKGAKKKWPELASMRKEAASK